MNGKPEAALLNSGSTVTLVRPTILARAQQDTRTLPGSCVHGDVQEFPAAEVRVSTFTGKWLLLTGLIPELPVSLLLWQDWPELPTATLTLDPRKCHW